MMKKIFAIVAMDQNRVIGKDNAIPWHIPEDMQHFKELTSGHAVLMGRKTFESLPKRFKPLPNRKNLVISSNPKFALEFPEVQVWSSPQQCIDAFKAGKIEGEKLWIIGGAQIYAATLDSWDEVYLTQLHGIYAGDAYLPKFEMNFELIEKLEQPNFSFLHFRRNSAG